MSISKTKFLGFGALVILILLLTNVPPSVYNETIPKKSSEGIMKRREKDEIATLPDKYRPLGAWKYFGLNILFAIPVVGWIFLLVFCFSSGNINRRSYARSFFCIWFIVIIIAVIVVVAMGGIAGLSGILDKFNFNT